MFTTLSDFIESISSYDINIPVWLQIGIVLVVLVGLVFGVFFLKDVFNFGYIKSGFMWYVFVAVINLISILVIIFFYNKKTGTYVGSKGVPGKKGKQGKKGTSVTCSYCKNNIYLQRVRSSDVICTLSSYTSTFQQLYDNFTYFNNIISNGNIDYSTFVDKIISDKKIDPSQNANVDKFRTLMTSSGIAISLIKQINDEMTAASERTYGTFRNPVGKVGYIPLGDSVYGGSETFELNSFVINGNVLYPTYYDLLVTFTSYNENTKDIDTYTIWRPTGQQITEKNAANVSTTYKYQSLGDVCRFGTDAPKLNEIATVREDCLQEFKTSDLQLVFIYVGDLDFNEIQNRSQMTESTNYLIENKIANNIQIFSVWRTPLNTFITNCNVTNDLVNNTLLYNIVNNVNDALNEFGNINDTYKQYINDILASIQISDIIVAMIICRHSELSLLQEIVYYFNRYSQKVPEFKNFDIKKASFADIMNKIKTVKIDYDNYNTELMKQASISLNSTSKTFIKYDVNREKKIPKQLMQIYDSINMKLSTISVQIENTKTLLDIVNNIFDNGLNGRIAVNADGIAEGGILLNEVQETVIRICKILMPPSKPAYTIKDECLGTFVLDRDRENVIKQFAKEKELYNKIIDEIANNNDKYNSILTNIRNYEDLMMIKIGELCGHVENYNNKINDMNMEEFTTSRIKGLIQIYKDTNLYLKSIVSTV
jgi:hypothetical protein